MTSERRNPWNHFSALLLTFRRPRRVTNTKRGKRKIFSNRLGPSRKRNVIRDHFYVDSVFRYDFAHFLFFKAYVCFFRPSLSSSAYTESKCFYIFTSIISPYNGKRKKKLFFFSLIIREQVSLIVVGVLENCTMYSDSERRGSSHEYSFTLICCPPIL